MSTTVGISVDVLNRFKRLGMNDRMAHAYLFVGPQGVGKFQTALAVAQLVNCEETASVCGICASCRKVSLRNHPDVHVIGDHQESAIKIDEIRQMLGRVGLRAYEARRKVFIIFLSERMTTEAANALLKTLEEPAPNTLIILTAISAEACLDTIRSRCHTVKFFCAQEQLPIERDRILDEFRARGNDEYIKELSANKEQTAQAMLVLLSWVRDVMLYKSGITQEHLMHQHRMADMSIMAQRDMDDLDALNKQIVHAKSLSDENLNVKMALSLVRQRLWGN